MRHTYVVLCCVKDEEDHGQWTGVGLTRNAGSSASSANHAFECSQGRRRRQAAATALEPESSISVGTRSKRVDAGRGSNYFITDTLLILLESKENVAAERRGAAAHGPTCGPLFSCQRSTSFWHAQKQGGGVLQECGLRSLMCTKMFCFCFLFLVSCEREE